MEVTVDDLGGLLDAASAAHRRMRASASRVTDEDCRGPSLLPGWTRGHVLTHWARNADAQARMLLAAMQGEIAEPYPGGDERREHDIEAGAARPARLILDDVRTAIDQIEDVWRRMPPDAWPRPTAARSGSRPAWMSVWARWRETEIHHVDLDLGYGHGDWPAEFVDLMLPRVMPTLATRLEEQGTVRLEVIDRGAPAAGPAAAGPADAATGEPVIVRGPASAVLCWLLGRPSAAAPDLAVTRGGQARQLPRLRAWA
jgi:maleylpyruvate isomerase